jgi:outer membrane protein, heavy metal efflux system
MHRLLSSAVACCAIVCALLSAAARAENVASALPLAPGQPIRFARIPPEPMPLPLASHPAMRQAEGLVRAARGEWLQVGLRPNPQLGYVGNEIGDEGRAGMQGGYVSQEFVTAGKLGLSRAVALREVAAAEQRLERTRQQIITTVRMYYYELLAAERSLAFSHQLQQVGSQALQASELRLKALEGTQASVLQSRVEADSAQLLVEQAINRRDSARRRLGSILGIDQSAPPPLEDVFANGLPALDWETLRAKLLAENPELSELRFNIDRARWATQRATAGRVPNVTVMSGAQYDYATQFAMANVQVSLPIPVFDRNQGGISQAYGELTAAQAALDGRELMLTQQLATAMSDYNTSSRRVAKYSESILPAARQSLDLVSSAYEKGELEYLDILATQRTYTEKNLDYLNNLEFAWKKWAEIDGLLVGPLTTLGN